MTQIATISRDAVQFARVPLHVLAPSPYNYNQHPPAQIADLKASLIRYRQVKPVVVQRVEGDGEGYIILAGHGITEAAKELFAESPEKYAHLNEWAIAIAPASWSIMDAKGYMVSDNELSRKAEADQELLAMLLEEQRCADYDLASLGADDETLRQMLTALGDGYLAKEEKMPEPGDADQSEVAERWGIIIECQDEQEQLTLLERFQEENISCRALVL